MSRDHVARSASFETVHICGDTRIQTTSVTRKDARTVSTSIYMDRLLRNTQAHEIK